MYANAKIRSSWVSLLSFVLFTIQVIYTLSYTSTMLEENFKRIIERATKPGAPPTLLLTIFLGANDACIMPHGEYVPLAKFEANIRRFVETILTEDNMPDTKIVYATPGDRVYLSWF